MFGVYIQVPIKCFLMFSEAHSLHIFLEIFCWLWAKADLPALAGQKTAQPSGPQRLSRAVGITTQWTERLVHSTRKYEMYVWWYLIYEILWLSVYCTRTTGFIEMWIGLLEFTRKSAGATKTVGPVGVVWHLWFCLQSGDMSQHHMTMVNKCRATGKNSKKTKKKSPPAACKATKGPPITLKLHEYSQVTLWVTGTPHGQFYLCPIEPPQWAQFYCTLLNVGGPNV